MMDPDGLVPDENAAGSDENAINENVVWSNSL